MCQKKHDIVEVSASFHHFYYISIWLNLTKFFKLDSYHTIGILIDKFEFWVLK